MEEKSYARRIKLSDGTLVTRYTALDPANESIWCTCGKPECPRARLLPFREHIAKLHRVLSELSYEELASESSGWVGVLYGLRMAASIEDVEAETGYVDDPMVFALCETTIDYEHGQSEMASKYVAGATIFNFLWHAYEAAVVLTAPTELVGLLKEQRLGERGRRLFEARPDLSTQFPGLGSLVRLTLFQCRGGGRLDQRLDRLLDRFPNHDLIAAAELVREFRNFLFHGEDEIPDHEEWGSVAVSRFRLYRFYTVSRLLLYLLQAFAWIAVAPITQSASPPADVLGDKLKRTLERLQFIPPKSKSSRERSESWCE
jgi:hypothetical protein